MPARVNGLKIRTLQCQRQGFEEGDEFLLNAFVCQPLEMNLLRALDQPFRLPEEPMITVFHFRCTEICSQYIEFMVPHDALRFSVFDPPLDESDYGDTVRAAVNEISQKNRAIAQRVVSITIISQSAKQISQRTDLTMDISEDIDRPLK